MVAVVAAFASSAGSFFSPSSSAACSLGACGSLSIGAVSLTIESLLLPTESSLESSSSSSESSSALTSASVFFSGATRATVLTVTGARRSACGARGDQRAARGAVRGGMRGLVNQ